MKILTFSFIILLLVAGIAKAEVFYSDQKICNAIWYVEGGEKANQEYGINPKYVKCENHLECQNMCIKTVAKWRRVYNLREHTHYKDFLTFLSYKYCPPNHVIWLKNLNFYLRKLK
jgi:hypothetical protein